MTRVLRNVTLVGEIVLDPRYTPPWPGAGIKSVDGSVPAEAMVGGTITGVSQDDTGLAVTVRLPESS
jgi:hypothetical protein